MSAYTNKYAHDEGVKYASKMSKKDLEYSMIYVIAY